MSHEDPIFYIGLVCGLASIVCGLAEWYPAALGLLSLACLCWFLDDANL